MLFKELEIPGVMLIQQQRRTDDRGFFARMFCQSEFAGQGLDNKVAQVNTAFSPQARTLRGVHFQAAPHAEVKMVRCLRGAVFDVAVDLRPGSSKLGRWTAVSLTAENGDMLYIPEGCAHGYLTLVPDTELMYFASVPYAPAAAAGVRYNDPAFNIAWPETPTVISQADRSWPDFKA